jgi:hypothetical protein
MKLKAKRVGKTSVGWMEIDLFTDPTLVEREGACRLWEPRKRRISVDPRESPQRQYDALLHEMIHAVDYLWNIGLSEHKTRLLATSLTQGLRGIHKCHK